MRKRGFLGHSELLNLTTTFRKYIGSPTLHVIKLLLPVLQLNVHRLRELQSFLYADEKQVWHFLDTTWIRTSQCHAFQRPYLARLVTREKSSVTRSPAIVRTVQRLGFDVQSENVRRTQKRGILGSSHDYRC